MSIKIKEFIIKIIGIKVYVSYQITPKCVCRINMPLTHFSPALKNSSQHGKLPLKSGLLESIPIIYVNKFNSSHFSYDRAFKITISSFLEAWINNIFSKHVITHVYLNSFISRQEDGKVVHLSHRFAESCILDQLQHMSGPNLPGNLNDVQC